MLEYISTSHTKSKLGYHIIFCTKFRHPVLEGPIQVETKHILAQTCITYEWILHEIEIMPDHVHMFIQTTPKDRLTDVVKTLKSISAIYVFTKFPKLKGQKFWGTGLWSKGCYYATVGSVSTESIQKYIQEQTTKDS